jgi:hypothetical protein
VSLHCAITLANRCPNTQSLREPDSAANYAAGIPEINVAALAYFAASNFWGGSIHPWNTDGLMPSGLVLSRSHSAVSYGPRPRSRRIARFWSRFARGRKCPASPMRRSTSVGRTITSTSLRCPVLGSRLPWENHCRISCGATALSGVRQPLGFDAIDRGLPHERCDCLDAEKLAPQTEVNKHARLRQWDSLGVIRCGCLNVTVVV